MAPACSHRAAGHPARRKARGRVRPETFEAGGAVSRRCRGARSTRTTRSRRQRWPVRTPPGSVSPISRATAWPRAFARASARPTSRSADRSCPKYRVAAPGRSGPGDESHRRAMWGRGQATAASARCRAPKRFAVSLAGGYAPGRPPHSCPHQPGCDRTASSSACVRESRERVDRARGSRGRSPGGSCCAVDRAARLGAC